MKFTFHMYPKKVRLSRPCSLLAARHKHGHWHIDISNNLRKQKWLNIITFVSSVRHLYVSDTTHAFNWVCDHYSRGSNLTYCESWKFGCEQGIMSLHTQRESLVSWNGLVSFSKVGPIEEGVVVIIMILQRKACLGVLHLELW